MATTTDGFVTTTADGFATSADFEVNFFLRPDATTLEDAIEATDKGLAALTNFSSKSSPITLDSKEGYDTFAPLSFSFLANSKASFITSLAFCTHCLISSTCASLINCSPVLITLPVSTDARFFLIPAIISSNCFTSPPVIFPIPSIVSRSLKDLSRLCFN